MATGPDHDTSSATVDTLYGDIIILVGIGTMFLVVAISRIHGWRMVMVEPVARPRGLLLIAVVIVGVLSLYSTVPGKFTPAHVERAQEYAQQASQALALSLRLTRHRDAESDVVEAMQSRASIDLAVGILMERNGCSQKEACDTLRSVSSSRNTKLGESAAEMIGTADSESVSTHFDR